MKSRIMFQVYLICLVRKLASPFVAEAALFLILGAALFFFVSVPSVVSNMVSSGDSYHYFIMAFSGADILVKTLLVLVAITAGFFVKNITLHTFLKEKLA